MEPKATQSSDTHAGSPNANGINPPIRQGPTDGVLVGRSLSGDKTAFDLLIGRYQRQAVAVSNRLLGNSHDALEVTQDAFLKAFTSLASLQKPAAFGGWLMRIVSNLSLNYRRGRKSRSQLPLDDLLGASDGTKADTTGATSDFAAQSGDPLRRLESEEMGRKLQEALASLPENNGRRSSSSRSRKCRKKKLPRL